ncbi:MAG: sugar transferase [Isosphaeraceae bacterium]|nr:sugar transferase [Isosphaeraceae bacterium]
MTSSAYSSSAYPHPGPDRFVPSVPATTPGVRFEVGKRAIDVTASFVLLCAGLPLLAAIAAGVKLTSPGPVFFRQKRLGRGGGVFWCYKFRSMVPDAEDQLRSRAEIREQFDENFKIRNDPRITPLGALLRRTSLDELPQLWNVLRGDMSMIGPRPIVEPELPKYGICAERLLTVKPGLGGIWQVSGRSETTYAERVAMDMQYIDSRSLALDLKLLALTVLTVVRGRGAY